VETISTIALERSVSSRTRLKEFWDLTKPRMNMVVVVTTVAGYYLAAPGSVEWGRLVPTLVGTARWRPLARVS
jgi:heme O synthase-like polyprenyltransferase